MASQPCRIIVVVGATGAQGGAVIDTLLNSPPSVPIRIRGLTRYVSSPASQALISRGVEMVAAKGSLTDDTSALTHAFKGAWAIFAVTDIWEQFSRNPCDASDAREKEEQYGCMLATQASYVDTLEHFIWSTEPNSQRLSGGKHIVQHFDGKSKVDDHIRACHSKSVSHRSKSLFHLITFLWVGFYAKNLQHLPMWKPLFNIGTESGKYSVNVPVDPETRFVSLGSLRNVGLAVAAVLAGEGSKSLRCEMCTTSRHQARYIAVNNGFFSLREYYEAWAAVVLKSSCNGTGIETLHQNDDAHLEPEDASLSQEQTAPANIEVRQIDAAEYEQLYGGFGREMRTMLEFWRDMGEQGSWRVSYAKSLDDEAEEDDGGASDCDCVVLSLQDVLAAKGQQVLDLKESFRELA
ncbi:hypothetical protein LTR84_013036 [Exophiala bonariae]|uniref:NmrA-like domain-containing protein n=1 Tax=Exophiala bonariae TaxID=1690606 RepID=A0AAV9NI53_9EURO|nr:hypothetical protein LTR84_013036 [Exophiala bonariae]